VDERVRVYEGGAKICWVCVFWEIAPRRSVRNHPTMGDSNTRDTSEHRLAALAAAVAAYEAEFGKISAAEIEAQQRADRAAAIGIRPTSHQSRRQQD